MTSARPAHVQMSQFRVVDDCLEVGGIPLTRLAQRVGRTPFYAYDRRLVRERVAELRTLLPQDIHLHYAMKANPMPAIVQLLSALVDGLDVASGGELAVALDTGITPTQISFAGPGKTDGELNQALAAGIIINLESESELERVTSIGAQLGLPPQIALRINPDFELKSSGMRMGGGSKQFGVDAERVPALLARLKSSDVAFHGFHIFTGSQNLRADAISEAQDRSVELALRLAELAPSPIRMLNIGGGFGIPYFPGEQRLDVAAVGENLARLQQKVRAALPGAELVLELGRYLIGEAGIYVARVIERKVSRGQVFLVTDGGLHHHLAASGNFGQVLRKNYPVVIGNHVVGNARERVSVVGPLCTPLDLLADQMEMARADVGDFVVIFQSGAYGATASPARFLSHPQAAEVLV